jgi:hypothetical protein
MNEEPLKLIESHVTDRQMHIGYYVQLYIMVLHQHVLITLVTIISVA